MLSYFEFWLIWLLGQVWLSYQQPIIHTPEPTCSVSEESVPNTFICSMNNNVNANAYILKFLLINPTQKEKFTLSHDGRLVTRTVIDRELVCPQPDKTCSMTLQIGVYYRAFTDPPDAFRINGFLEPKIIILDQNDNSPYWPSPEIVLRIPEAAPVGSTFDIQNAIDRDSKTFGVESYELRPRSDTFAITPSSGWTQRKRRTEGTSTTENVRIVLKQQLDRERKATYQFTVIASDGGSPPRTGSVSLKIVVDDINDNAPRFSRPVHNLKVPEDTPVGATLHQFNVTDTDIGRNAELKFSVDLSVAGSFTVTRTGALKLLKQLDFEVDKRYDFFVTASDRGDTPKSARARVVVNVINVNDNPPKVIVSSIFGRLEVKENEKRGYPVGVVSVSDDDDDDNPPSCYLNDTSNMFMLEPLSASSVKGYNLITSGPVDRETNPIFTVMLICVDADKVKPYSTVKQLQIYVTDKNDNAPEFDPKLYNIQIAENNRPNIVILNASASDRDEKGTRNSELVYSLSSNVKDTFAINEKTGAVSIRKSLDREVQDKYVFDIHVRDNGEVPKFANHTAQVVVNISDINDNDPQFNSTFYKMSIYENQPPGHPVGSVFVTDPDIVSQTKGINLILTDPSGLFEIDKSGQIKTTKSLDREVKEKYILKVTASDVGTAGEVRSSRVTVEVSVKDLNDNEPVIKYPIRFNNTAYVTYTSSPGHPITQIDASDKDAGQNSRLTYEVVSGNDLGLFFIDPASGQVSLFKHLKEDNLGSYQLKFLVSDNGAHLQHVKNTSLTIAVIRPSGLLNMRAKDTLGETESLVIIIILTSVSALVSVVIVIVILLVRGRECARRRDELYMASNNEQLRVGVQTPTSPEKKVNLMVGIQPIPQKCYDRPELLEDVQLADNCTYSITSDDSYSSTKQRELLPTPGSERVRKFLKTIDENGSVCDSGKGASDEDLRAQRENIYNSMTKEGYHGNSNMKTFTPKLKPKPTVTFSDTLPRVASTTKPQNDLSANMDHPEMDMNNYSANVRNSMSENSLRTSSSSNNETLGFSPLEYRKPGQTEANPRQNYCYEYSPTNSSSSPDYAHVVPNGNLFSGEITKEGAETEPILSPKHLLSIQRSGFRGGGSHTPSTMYPPEHPPMVIQRNPVDMPSKEISPGASEIWQRTNDSSQTPSSRSNTPTPGSRRAASRKPALPTHLTERKTREETIV